MHELSIAMSIIERVGEEIDARGGVPIEAIHLRIGDLSGIDNDALAFAFALACEGTPLQGARLQISRIPVIVHCARCDEDRTPESLHSLACPTCHQPEQTIVQGRELELSALELAA